MYEKHFGLKTRPFGSKAEGTGVFVGPQQTKMIASLQKGLGAPDAVVTVTGPAGVGKTTIVNRALETLPTGRTAAQIGRMHLSPEEVVNLLMGGFGIKRNQQGSIRRFAAFRRLLQQQSESGIPVAIVIEDAQKLGTAALAEVEALTAADAGDAGSANIILMGQPGLHDLLTTPDLGRLKQRIRLRQSAESLSPAEVQGYLKHSVRQAGGDYDAIFDNGVAEIIYGCSEGIPRVINTLCESAMTTAMEENSTRITVALMSQVASDAFGYEADTTDTPLAAGTAAADGSDEDIDWEAPPEPAVVAEPEVVTKADRREIGHDLVVESGCYPVPTADDLATPVEPAPDADSDIDDSESGDDAGPDSIPELINDTQPGLPELQQSVVEDHADIPVLNSQGEESTEGMEAAVTELPDIESTQTQLQPVGLTIDEAVDKAPTDEPATPDEDAKNDDKSAEDFDLDAALSPEVDSTNVMPGITPNLDELAAEKIEATVIQEVVEPEPAPKPQPEAKPEAEAKPEPAPVAKEEPDHNDLPTLSNSMRVDVKKEVARAEETESAAPPAAKPATKPAPCLDATTNAPAMLDPANISADANRKSDIDALEAALAAAKNGEISPQTAIPAIPSVNGAAPELHAEETPAAVAEITLDNVIEKQQLQNAQLDKFREEIGSANSLEDISDMTAETLFGCEAFNEIAAGVVANPPEVADSGTTESEPSPVELTSDEMPGAANDAADQKQDDEPPAMTPLTEATPEVSVPLNESVAMRIDMLNAMKSNPVTAAENVELGEDNPANGTSARKGPQPEPIERQINTSMTQTLEALNVSKAAESPKKEKVEKKSGGLFSRFRKSS
jgi:general secretion pathway protein A